MVLISKAGMNAPCNGDKKTVMKIIHFLSQYFNKPVNHVISPGSLV